MSLKQLIQKSKKQDLKSQSEIYQLFAGKLFALCVKYSKTHHEAEDNLQEAFIIIFKKIGQYKFKGSFEGWMKRIVINTALQTYRKKKVLNLVEENYPDEVEVDVNEEDVSLDFLLRIIQELPDRYRMVFNLYVLDGYSHREISELLGIAEGTSKSNLSRARVILKDKVELNQQQQNVGLF
ncbi:MAG: RNA polymerase sigma factor [Flavobacteriaceae bacterium]|nr:RNA polymerase sigma factor [Flavobacteriaceae bacterium]